MKNLDRCDPFLGGCRDTFKPLDTEPSLEPPEAEGGRYNEYLSGINDSLNNIKYYIDRPYMLELEKENWAHQSQQDEDYLDYDMYYEDMEEY
jgi:hypothetical protein